MFMNCHILNNTIVQNQRGCKSLPLFVEKIIDLVLHSFIATNHRLAQSDIDVKSWFSLEAQSLGDWTFSSPKKFITKKKQGEKIVTGRSLM